MRKITTALLAASLSSSLFAKDAQYFPCCGIQVTGLIDGSYNHLKSNNQFVSEVFDRAYDIKEDGFTLHQLSLTVANQPEKGLGGLVNAIYGRDALSTAPYGINPQVGDGPMGFDAVEAYLQYAYSPFTLIGGRFMTLAGSEVLDPSGNTSFSRSLLYTFAQPLTHLGVRGTYAVNDKLKLILGVNNGWDSVRDTGRDKTIEMGVSYDPWKQLSLTGQFYTGEERVIPRTDVGETGRRNLLDLVATIQLIDKMNLVLNYDYGVQHHVIIDDVSKINATWQGIAATFNYQFHDDWKLSLRGEDFDDHNGYRTGVRQTLKEMTLTLGYSPWQDVEFRAEVRRDKSNTNAYVKRHSEYPSSIQQSFAVEALYKFKRTLNPKPPSVLPSYAKANPIRQEAFKEYPSTQNVDEPKTKRKGYSHSAQELYLLSLPQSHYTIQLLGARSEDNVRQFIFDHHLENQAYYFRTMRGGSNWYALIYGDYPSKSAASLAKQQLPYALSILTPWVRDIGSVQSDIQRGR